MPSSWSLLFRAIAAAVMSAVLLSSPARSAEMLSVISFNIESDQDTDPRKVAQEIAKLSAAGQVDLFGLAEVQNQFDADLYQKAADREGAGFRYLLAKNGNEDRVAILYNYDTLKFREVFELDRLPGSRKALIARFQHKTSDVEFLFIVNHFNRRDTERRQRQARLIRDWVLKQPLPAILVGDYNFDYDPSTQRGNRSFEIFTEDEGLVWLRPACVEDGTCPATGTQCDSRYNSISDFVFIADQKRGWKGLSKVLFQRANYCDRERRGYSDHRPVLGLIEVR